MKKYRWINEDIVIDFPVPPWWQEQFEEYEAMDLKGDVAYLFVVCDMDHMMHQDIIDGVLTPKQVRVLCEKYYGRKVYDWIEKNEH